MSLFSKMSTTAKIINCAVALPAIAAALYLFWSGHDSMMWVNGVRDAIVSDSTSMRRTDKIGFVVVLFSVGIPALIPSIAHDYIKKVGLFAPKNA